MLASFAIVLSAACSGGGSPTPSSTDSQTATFAAQMGSGDLWIMAPQRVQVGVFASTPNGGVQLATFGSVGLSFRYLGSGGGGYGPVTRATYLPAPTTPGGTDGPVLSDPGTARGVYQADGVTFDHAGSWQVKVTADVQGAGAQELTAAFTVLDRPLLPAPGQRALKTDNLTLSSKGVPASAIDSRAQDGAKVPDPQLHRWTIAKALAQHRPILVIFATPVYCQSQFCGPTTDAVQQLAQRYPDRAVFIHVEIWKDYAKHVVNQAASQWLLRNGDLTEPWLYLIGSDGVIADRWGPLFDPSEVAKELQALPPMKP